ncbi:MAG: hypothetical protein GEU71_14740 [Actinobacteria bacterium]|nr:hypothetical protein [Actinomycetota bacterium]
MEENRIGGRAAILAVVTAVVTLLAATVGADQGDTIRVSVDSTGNQGNDTSSFPSISADGRYVAFSSTADNLVSGDANGFADVFVHDTASGVTSRVSIDSNGVEGNKSSSSPSLSSDGRYVAFSSHATNLVPGDVNQRACQVLCVR